MAIAYVRDTGKIRTTGTGQTSSASFGTLPTVGNLIVAGGITYYVGQNNGAVALSDNQGNSWATDVQVGSGPTDDDQTTFIGSAIANTSAGTFTVTVDASGTTNTFYTWMAVEFSGNVASAQLDKTATTSQAGGTTTITVGPTATLSQADELVVTACADNTSVNVTSITASGYTTLFDEPDGTTFGVAGMAYKIVNSTSAVSATWNWTNSTGPGQGAVIATYLATTSTPIPVSNMRLGRIAPTVWPG